MKLQTECPNRDRLKLLLLGKLPTAQTESLSEHLLNCESCSKISESIDATDEVVDALASEGNPSGDEEILAAAIQRGKQLSPPTDAKLSPDSMTTAAYSQRVVECGVLSAEELEKCQKAESKPLKTGEDLAKSLVRQKKLTKFQAQMIYSGKGTVLVLGNYVLLDKIGAGGMGQVFKAVHQRMDRVVALKILSPALTKDSGAVSRFQREAKAAAKLSHPNIVAAHDAGQHGKTHFLVMEYIDGIDLSALVKKSGPLSVEKAIDFIRQASRGLQFAHEEGVVHRDVKPGNLLVDRRGQVRVLDMGLARLDNGSAELTSTGDVMGTVDFMSPEQASDTKNADARSDVYSLGCALYFLLHGKPPYSGDTLVSRIMAHREQPIPPLGTGRDDIPGTLEMVFNRMLAKDLDERYPSMSDVAAALGNFGVNTLDATEEGHRQVDPELRMFFESWEHDQSSQSVQKPRQQDTQRPGMMADTKTERYEPSRGKQPRNVSRTRGGKTPRHRGKQRPVSRTMLWWGIAATATLAIIMAVVIFRVKTTEGTIVLKLSQDAAAGAVVTVDGEQTITIKSGTADETFEIKADGKEHTLKITHPDFVTYAKKFVAKSKGKQIFEVTLVPVGKKEPKNPDKWIATPAQQKFLDSVAKLKPEQQVEAVRTQLKLLNPGFDGKLKYKIEQGQVTEIKFLNNHITDISPIRALEHLQRLFCGDQFNGKSKLADLAPLQGLQLTSLYCPFTKISDLSPLRGMPLTSLAVFNTQVDDLSPLQGMPLSSINCGATLVADLSPLRGMKLSALTCASTRVVDLSPLKGMPLKTLECTATDVSDLSPLKGMKLTSLGCDNTQVSDLSLVQGMPLTVLRCKNTGVTDFTPLKGMKLEVFDFSVETGRKHAPILRAMTTLRIINRKPAAEFWKQLQTPATGSKPWQPTAKQQAFFDRVAKLKPEQQVEAVREQLKLLNPGFDGRLGHKIEKGHVVHLGLHTDHVTDISPVRALKHLRQFNCGGSNGGKGQLADLAPLQGLQLESFSCEFSRISDLSPLRGMPLTSLKFHNTQVADLSPLRGMSLSTISCAHTLVADLSPLRGMPLTNLRVQQTRVSDLSILRGMPLTELDCSWLRIADLSPFKGMKLTLLNCSNTQVSDLSLLQGMPLTTLRFEKTGVTDFSPLKGMKLENLGCDASTGKINAPILRAMKTLKTINYKPAAEFWKQLQTPATGSKPWQPTAKQQAFFDKMAKFNTDNRIQAVRAQLKLLNPGFDGEVNHKIEKGRVVELQFVTDRVTDISPVRAFTHLERLHCHASGFRKGRLADLSPLQGMKLTELNLSSNMQITDLSPLKGMPLTSLNCGSTCVSSFAALQGMKLAFLDCSYMPVSDLKPLQGMPLSHLSCNVTRVFDLSPLKGMPLKYLDCNNSRVADLSPLMELKLTHLICSGTAIADLSPLKGMPLTKLNSNLRLFHLTDETLIKSFPLTTLNNKSPAEVWKEIHTRRRTAEEFVKSATRLSVEDRIKAVRAELPKLPRKLNPGERVTLETKVDNKKVAEATLVFNAYNFYHLTPLMAFKSLQKLTIDGGVDYQDLSCLKFLPLESLTCPEQMAGRNAPILKGIKTLKSINGQPAAKFWNTDRPNNR